MMKKNTTTTLIGCLLCLHSTFVIANDLITPPTDIKPYAAKRQAVDKLLTNALIAFQAPTHSSQAGFTVQTPNNLDIVTSQLLQAYELEPYRTDLLISAANAQIYKGDVNRAIALFTQAQAVAPDDIDILSYLAVWQNFKGNNAESIKQMAKLASLNPGRQADIEHIINTVDHVIAIPLKTMPFKTYSGNTAIICLGYASHSDGTMSDILIQRLKLTLALANQAPKAVIIVTGGVPNNHNTESKLMANWLIKHGISPHRIIEDNYARSTVESALYVSYTLARHKIDHATIVNSANYARHSQTLFDIASWQTGPRGILFDSVSVEEKPLSILTVPSNKELISIYRDALRVYGLRSYRSYPLDQR
ncbi:ElyC/SanA/YdcF family protein [Photobacterium toruni]|uniref:ElyC/SanA/YdcF family protein n=2 Tax=Photobacterium toruni TaxID=1935446 RepID=A0ABU6L2S4_9GAMM|nr:ElyC/SanA/YdcF family protein [Photobacterium toruni]